jgi:8-oxo-dGTP diphosphatase
MTEPATQRTHENDSAGASAPIRIAAAVILNAEQRTLLVRKRGTAFFMQPGGKIEPGESELAALARELGEELGYMLAGSNFLGNFSSEAANEPSRRVEAALYLTEVSGEMKLGAEIEECAWVDPRQPGEKLIAPLTLEHVLPLVARFLAGW